MTKPPDLEALARRYVELWQDQVAAAAADPELTEALVRMMQLTGSGLAATTAMWQTLWAGAASRYAAPAAGFGAGGRDDHDGSARYPSVWAAPAPGATPAAGASPVGGRDLAELDARLALLEKRLAAMEGGPKPARRRPRKRTRRDAPS
jgi:hypothetical protein